MARGGHLGPLADQPQGEAEAQRPRRWPISRPKLFENPPEAGQLSEGEFETTPSERGLVSYHPFAELIRLLGGFSQSVLNPRRPPGASWQQPVLADGPVQGRWPALAGAS